MRPWVWQREASESRLSGLEAKDQDQAGSEQMDVADKGLERGWFRFHLLWWRVGHHGCGPRAQEA